MKRNIGEQNRRHTSVPFVNPEVAQIMQGLEAELGDPLLTQSLYFGPTALTQIRRIIDQGGSIVTDTTLAANDIDETLLGGHGARVLCFIDDPQVVQVAEQRRVTRAEVATDFGLQVPGPKLMVVGSAPAAIQRILQRRRSDPMSDICVLAAPVGFAGVVQIKERLIENDLCCIVVRGKKGGVPVTVSILNAILRWIHDAKLS
ncbi:MAG: precorrin-8X methylmutase [Clostridia bacterium]|nr:precorrin-8X methylmutase [Clostridia bacterium]